MIMMNIQCHQIDVTTTILLLQHIRTSLEVKGKAVRKKRDNEKSRQRGKNTKINRICSHLVALVCSSLFYPPPFTMTEREHHPINHCPIRPLYHLLILLLLLLILLLLLLLLLLLTRLNEWSNSLLFPFH